MNGKKIEEFLSLLRSIKWIMVLAVQEKLEKHTKKWKYNEKEKLRVIHRRVIEYEYTYRHRFQRVGLRDDEIEFLRTSKIADAGMRNVSWLVSRHHIVPYAHLCLRLSITLKTLDTLAVSLSLSMYIYLCIRLEEAPRRQSELLLRMQEEKEILFRNCESFNWFTGKWNRTSVESGDCERETSSTWRRNRSSEVALPGKQTMAPLGRASLGSVWQRWEQSGSDRFDHIDTIVYTTRPCDAGI